MAPSRTSIYYTILWAHECASQTASGSIQPAYAGFTRVRNRQTDTRTTERAASEVITRMQRCIGQQPF